MAITVTVTSSRYQSADRIGLAAWAPSRLGHLVLVAGAAFVLYWISSWLIGERDATMHFGADAYVYALLAEGRVVDRIARFHPVTVAMSVGWMELLRPLTAWISPHQLLKAMFAAVGGAGVAAAVWGFAAVVPRGYATLCGMIYAGSFGIWYFSSIEESKIVTASLSVLYIAGYLHLRERWTMRGAVLLTAVLLLACLNEIVSGFLVVIPVVDTVMRRGLDWRQGRWIAAHAMAGPVALIILEGIINRLVAPARDAEGASHLSMLMHYIAKNDYSAASLYAFVVNWLFFNIAAPTPHANHLATPSYGGSFAPALADYFISPASAALVVPLGVMVMASVLPRDNTADSDKHRGILLALAAYAIVRGVFFFIFNPPEPLLFSPAVTLAHLLIICIPFTASGLPAKRMILAVLAALLFVNNGAFFVGQ